MRGPEVRGRVLTEEAGTPVPAVEVRFRDGASAPTDRRGEYRIRGIDPGWHDVAVVTAACGTALGRIRVEPEGEWLTNLSLPEAMAREHAGLLPSAGDGILLGEADLTALPAPTLADVLRREVPELGIGVPGQPGRTAEVQGRNRATLSGKITPLFILDGIRMGTDPRILWDLVPGDVAWVEVIRSSSGAWRYGPDAAGGAVRIFTRGGAADAAFPASPGRCAPVVWGGGVSP